jgi:hypothetical protein
MLRNVGANGIRPHDIIDVIRFLYVSPIVVLTDFVRCWLQSSSSLLLSNNTGRNGIIWMKNI